LRNKLKKHSLVLQLLLSRKTKNGEPLWRVFLKTKLKPAALDISKAAVFSVLTSELISYLFQLRVSDPLANIEPVYP